MSDSSTETASAAEGINESGTAAEALSPNTDVTAASSPAASDAKPAESSPAQTEKPKDMLEVVRNALNKPKEEAPSASKDGKPETAEPDPEPDQGLGDAPEDLSKDERAQLSAKTTNRLRYLDRGMKHFKAEAEKYKPVAERMTQIDTFIQNAGLNNQEVNAGFEMMRLMKIDPVRAYEAITPIFLQLRKLAGEVLPPDLKDEVDRGVMPAARALEISRTKAREANYQRQTEVQTQRSAQQARQETIDNSTRTLSEWDAKWKASDADYRLKFPIVQDKIRIALAEYQRQGIVPTPQQTRDMAETAKKEAEAVLKPLASNRKQAIDPGPTGSPSNPAAKPKPRSYRDAVNQVLGLA